MKTQSKNILRSIAVKTLFLGVVLTISCQSITENLTSTIDEGIVVEQSSPDYMYTFTLSELMELPLNIDEDIVVEQSAPDYMYTSTLSELMELPLNDL